MQKNLPQLLVMTVVTRNICKKVYQNTNAVWHYLDKNMLNVTDSGIGQCCCWLAGLCMIMFVPYIKKVLANFAKKGLPHPTRYSCSSTVYLEASQTTNDTVTTCKCVLSWTQPERAASSPLRSHSRLRPSWIG